MARAINSFPVPVSPVIRTLESVEATFATRARTDRKAGDPPTISSKHRCFVDFFTQGNVLVLQSLFSFLAILDIGCRGIPTRDMPQSISNWVAPKKEPAILSVVSQQTRFDLMRGVTQEFNLVFAHHAFPIIGVKEPLGIATPPFFQSKPVIA
jgi:hypothetical protein